MNAPEHRPRSPWAGHQPATDATRAPVRQSLSRFYKSRTDPTRTRSARRATLARARIRRIKTRSA